MSKRERAALSMADHTNAHSRADPSVARLLNRRRAALLKLGVESGAEGQAVLVFGATTAARILGVSVAALKRLVEPVGTATNPHHRSGPRVGLYDPLDLLRVSRQRRAQQAKERTVGRSDAAKLAVQTNVKRLCEPVEALVIRVESLPVAEVRVLAIAHYNAQRAPDKSQADGGSADEFLQRIVVNYIRHELTIYDRAVTSLWGRTGKDKALDRLRERIYDAIADTYPDLAAECGRQALARLLNE